MYKDRREQEQDLVSGMLWNLDTSTLQRWNATKASHRFMAYKLKQLVIYRMAAGKHVVVDTLTCHDLSLGAVEGLSSMWVNQEGKRIEVGHTPVEIQPSVFIWHSFLTDLVYSPHRGVYTNRFSMIIRSDCHPDYPVEGLLYIKEKTRLPAEVFA